MATSSCNEDVEYTQSGLHLEAWSTPPAVAYTCGRGVHQLWRTPKVVHTTSRGVHLKWSTPRGSGPPKVVYTSEEWSTPPTVAYTQSGLHLEEWSTPPTVAYTQSGLHHLSALLTSTQNTPQDLMPCYGMNPSERVNTYSSR